MHLGKLHASNLSLEVFLFFSFSFQRLHSDKHLVTRCVMPSLRSMMFCIASSSSPWGKIITLFQVNFRCVFFSPLFWFIRLSLTYINLIVTFNRNCILKVCVFISCRIELPRAFFNIQIFSLSILVPNGFW